MTHADGAQVAKLTGGDMGQLVQEQDRLVGELGAAGKPSDKLKLVDSCVLGNQPQLRVVEPLVPWSLASRTKKSKVACHRAGVLESEVCGFEATRSMHERQPRMPWAHAWFTEP